MVRSIRAAIRTVLWGGGLLALTVASWLTEAARAEEPGPTAEELTAELYATQRQVRLILGDVLGQGAFDVAAVLDVMGQDPEALARWVREQTTHVPYRGLVRGEFGVLQDRLGNHLDRAMLLGRLIEATGRPVRLEVMASQDIPPSSRSLDERPSPQPVTLSAGTRELLVRLGTLPDEPAPSLSRLPGWNRFDQDLQARAVSLMERLAGDPGFPGWHEQDHQRESSGDPSVRVWWEDDQERWVATDLGDVAPGEGGTSQAQAAPGEVSQSLSAVSRRYAHRYEMEVVAERWHEGRFERVTLLEHDLEAHALAMQAIRVGVVPEEFEVDDFYMADPDQALAENLLANTAWVPYLRYGDELVLGDIMDDEGRVRDPMQPAQARQLQEATNLLGGIGLGGRAEEDGSGDAFIGLSLEVTLRHGDVVVNRLSRPWFSLAAEETPPFELEPEHRLERAVSLVRDTNMLLQVAEPSDALLLRMELSAFLNNAQSFQGMIMGLETDDFELVEGAVHELLDLPQTAMQFARHRFTTSLNPGRFYIGEPNLLIEHTGLKQTSEGFRDYRAIDLAHVPLHLVASGDNARHLRFSQGVLETLLEAELLAQRNPVPDRDRVLDGENAALHLEAAMARGEMGSWLSPEQANRLDDIALPMLSRRAIQEHLERGHHLHFPLLASLDVLSEEEALPLAWWAVNPHSGHTLGYGGMGWGQELIDYLHLAHAKVYLLKASLAPGVAKSTLGTSLVCLAAGGLIGLQVYSTLGNDLPWVLDEAGGQAERIANFCLDVINRRLPPGS
ncbi:hypothetical protein [Halomonas campaniensis]|uniref:hypothetical protein n=1 Tax=Halomonas campaniensis TaxID=213554 RepID=UPI003561B42E